MVWSFITNNSRKIQNTKQGYFSICNYPEHSMYISPLPGSYYRASLSMCNVWSHLCGRMCSIIRSLGYLPIVSVHYAIPIVRMYFGDAIRAAEFRQQLFVYSSCCVKVGQHNKVVYVILSRSFVFEIVAFFVLFLFRLNVCGCQGPYIVKIMYRFSCVAKCSPILSEDGPRCSTPNSNLLGLNPVDLHTVLFI